MDKRLDRLEDKIDKQDGRMDSINLILTEMKGDLKEHMRRSVANEEANILLQQKIEQDGTLIDSRLAVLEKVKDRFHFLGWVIVAAIGVLEGLKALGLF